MYIKDSTPTKYYDCENLYMRASGASELIFLAFSYNKSAISFIMDAWGGTTIYK